MTSVMTTLRFPVPSAAISRPQHVWKAEGVEMIMLGSHCSPPNPLKLNFHSLLSKLSVLFIYLIYFFWGPSSVKCSVFGGKPCKCETQGFIFRFSKILWRKWKQWEWQWETHQQQQRGGCGGGGGVRGGDVQSEQIRMLSAAVSRFLSHAQTEN